MAVCITTEQGKRTLGKVAKEAREAAGWSMQNLADELKNNYGLSITTSAISDLEGGKRELQWNTVARLVALEYIRSPQTGEPYSISDLFKIACEVLDPQTGVERETVNCKRA